MNDASDKEILARIQELKQQRKAVILAHNYQPADIQALADFCGDSYGLSVKASQLADAEVIVFCGVKFMAETAAILNPDKIILLPDASAGCPMADMINAEQLRALKAKHPGAPAICYVNSTAEVKAECDCCCTSSNAVKIVNSYKEAADILFVPDQNLGKFVEKQLGRGMILWDGCCPIHRELTPALLQKAKAAHPGAKVLVHPECRPETQKLADYVLATGPMITLVKEESQNPHGIQEWIVGTECGILATLKETAPTAKFYPVEPALICQDMKKTTPAKVLAALETLSPRVTVPAPIAAKARLAIQNMLAK